MLVNITSNKVDNHSVLCAYSCEANHHHQLPMKTNSVKKATLSNGNFLSLVFLDLKEVSFDYSRYELMLFDKSGGVCLKEDCSEVLEDMLARFDEWND